MKKTLAVETSCDDTCVAVVCEDGRVLTAFKQDQNTVHQPFGGVVPERASRCHSLHLLNLVDQALSQTDWKDICVLSCTNRPGLMGSLLVGAITVKTLAQLYQKPWIGVNHIEGHILSPFVYDSAYPKAGHWGFPYLALVVSGGHTHLFLAQDFSRYVVLGRTLDDSAGEAFDKFAKLLGLSYPGGVQVDQLSKTGDPGPFSFPVALKSKGNLDFSFSGLKTSARLVLDQMNKDEVEKNKPSLCAGFQQAVVQQILFKLNECVKKYPHCPRVALVGGVSANSQLRHDFQKWADQKGLDCFIPPLKYCTDNAGMIGYAGIGRFLRGEKSSMSEGCFPHSLKGDFL